MGKILIEFENKTNTTEVNTAYLTTIFSMGNGVTVRVKSVKEITSDDLNWCDVYLSIRPISIYSLELARKVKGAGAFYMVLFDDDLMNTDANPSRRWRVKYARACLELADVVIGPNPVLVEEYAHFTKTKRCAVVNYTVMEGDILPIETSGKTVKIVYAAGRDHAHFFSKYIKPVMNFFLKNNYERVDITFIGVEPELEGIEHKECFHFVPNMPYEKYSQYMRENRFDLGLAPLSDKPFENRKYFMKFIEYTKYGIMGLYSNCMPYTLVVQDKVNGLLIDNDPVCWLNALQDCVNNVEIVKRYAENAQQQLKREFTVDSAVKVYQSLLPEIENYRKSPGKTVSLKKNRIKYACFDFRDICSRLMYHIRTDGVRKTVHYIAKHTRR